MLCVAHVVLITAGVAGSSDADRLRGGCSVISALTCGVTIMVSHQMVILHLVD